MNLESTNRVPVLLLVATLAFFNGGLRAQRDSSAIKKCIPSPDVYMGQVVYKVADKMPMFRNGDPDFMNYISKNLIYPEGNKESSIRSKFYVTCIIDTLGKAQDVCCITSYDYDPVEKQMIELIQHSTGWTPGMMDGKNVCVRLIIPLLIDLK